MENQYNFYKPEAENMNQEYQRTEPEFEMGIGAGYGTSSRKRGKTKKKVPGAVKAICFGLIVGMVGGLTFTGVSFVGFKMAGIPTDKSSMLSPSSNEDAEIATAKLVTGSGTESTSNVSQIAETALPSIVSITNLSVTQVQDFFGGIRDQQSESAGSGIIISKTKDELLIVTNNHVVEGYDSLTVSFVDEESCPANIKGTDASRDLAVISVSLSELKNSTKKAIAVATMGDSTTLKAGEPVVAIGNALGYGQSVTSGVVSATKRSLQGLDGELIQTDAAINPGNSGGALLNAKGEVIGINSAKVATSSVEGMGYAIPISDVKDIIEDLMNKKTKTKVSQAERGYIGISGLDVSEDGAQMYNMPMGVYVSEVVKGGGADKAGITKGCVITGFEGATITGMDSLQEQLQYCKVGDVVEITIKIPASNGEYTEKTVEVTLGSNK